MPPPRISCFFVRSRRGGSLFLPRAFAKASYRVFVKICATHRDECWAKKRAGPTLLLKIHFQPYGLRQLLRRDGAPCAPFWPVPPRTWTDAWDMFQRAEIEP